MIAALWAFWISIALIVYTIAGYPALLLALWSLRGPRPVAAMSRPRSVDFLIPAHNEAAVIREKIRNTLALENPDGHKIRVLVVSDGSTDDTVALARSIHDPKLEVIETPGRLGKLGALNHALERLTGEIVIFSDANSLLDPRALAAMLPHFEDEAVGGVCGQIRIDVAGGGDIARADNFFWRYDQWMKHAESDLGGVVSAQGSIYALRRHLTAPIPPGYADDFLMSVRAVQQGYRLAFEPVACTSEPVTEQVGREMGRRIRSTLMGWRGLMTMRGLMNPLRHGLYAWQLFSHKALRRLVPFFLVLLLVSSIALIGHGPFYTFLALAQIGFYALAALAWIVPLVRRLPLVGKVLFFVTANLAMAAGIVQYYRGREISGWTPIRE